MRSLLRSLFVCLAAVIVLPPAMPEHPQLNAPRVPLAAEVAIGPAGAAAGRAARRPDPSYLHIRRRGAELPVQIDGDFDPVRGGGQRQPIHACWRPTG
ncbi:MAG: hypothetical protein U0Z44_05915 [Kouleothrix sp.]